jgi:hypothetical protein
VIFIHEIGIKPIDDDSPTKSERSFQMWLQKLVTISRYIATWFCRMWIFLFPWDESKNIAAIKPWFQSWFWSWRWCCLYWSWIWRIFSLECYIRWEEQTKTFRMIKNSSTGTYQLNFGNSQK